MADRVLLVDDNKEFVDTLSLALGDEFNFIIAHSGVSALKKLETEKPDVALVDLHMQDGDGKFFCEKVAEKADFPIIIITGNADLPDRIELYNVGAEDVIHKPFSFDELRAKIKVRLRHRKSPQESSKAEILQFKNCQLNTRRRELTWEQKTHRLSQIECQILKLLMSDPHNFVDRERLYKDVWSGQHVSTRTVDVHIANLRKKLPKDIKIESVYGRGYGLRQTEKAD